MTFPNGWLPVQMDQANDRITFLKISFPSDLNVALPVFSDKVKRYRNLHSEAEEKIGSLDDLRQYRETDSRPQGLVFHASRVGSTTIVQAFESVSNSLVMAEGPMINAAIKVAVNPSKVLKSVVRGTGQFQKSEDRLVIKLSSWNITRANVFFEAYPDIPWVFIYRDPVEIMVSIVKVSTGWARNYENPALANELLGLDPEVVKKASYETYLALGIDKMFRSALENVNGNEMFINYTQLDTAQIEKIAQHFKIELTSGDIEAISRSLEVYSKDAERTQTFVPDSEQKQKMASSSIKQAAKLVSRSFQALEARKRS